MLALEAEVEAVGGRCGWKLGIPGRWRPGLEALGEAGVESDEVPWGPGPCHWRATAQHKQCRGQERSGSLET